MLLNDSCLGDICVLLMTPLMGRQSLASYLMTKDHNGPEERFTTCRHFTHCNYFSNVLSILIMKCLTDLPLLKHIFTLQRLTTNLSLARHLWALVTHFSPVGSSWKCWHLTAWKNSINSRIHILAKIIWAAKNYFPKSVNGEDVAQNTVL